MSVFVIADLHLDTESKQKSMEVFGNRWVDYVYKIQKNWRRLVGENDTVIVPGDISWALNLKEAISQIDIDSPKLSNVLIKSHLLPKIANILGD